MLLKAYLTIDDLKLVIKNYSAEVNKYVDYNNNYPSKKGQHRGFHLTVEAPQNNFLWEEAIKNYSMTSLMQIRFEPAIIGSEKTRVISMFDCHIVNHKVNYHHQSNEPLTETIHIICGGVEDSWFPSTVYEEHWRITFPTQEDSVTDDEEPGILNYQIEDLDGNILQKSEIDIDEQITVVVETENAIGKTLQIDLDSNRLDFEHNGIALEDDILEINITKDIEEIHLKAIAQKN